MERDFEQEFRKLKQDEIPDLWSRIEAGLSEKKDAAPAQGNAIAIDKRKRKRKAEKTSVWRKWGTLIAACVCVAVIFPVISLFVRNRAHSGGRDGMANNMMESAVEYASDNTAMEESGESMAGAADTTAAVEDAAAADGGDLEAEAPADEAIAADTTADDGGDTDLTASAEAAAEETAAEEEAVWDDLTDGQILEEAIVQIQKAEKNGEETIYQAVVLQADADNVLECESQIALLCNADTEYVLLREPRDKKELKEQETYRVTLRYDVKEEGFVVLAAESWNLLKD